MELRLRGSRLTASIDDAGDNYVQVEVDGGMNQVLHLQPGLHDYSVNLSSGVHEIRLVKRTESFVGTVAFTSFSTDGVFLKPSAPRHVIEFVGDSITCGYGNEGKSQNEHFSPAAENADLSYGWIAARALNAQARIIAWSGRKMWPDNTVPEIYDRAIPTDPGSVYDFTKAAKPDVVLINLATNDFGQGVPDKAKWCSAYEQFIARLRGLYPKAQVYCAIGSMMTDQWPPQHALTTLRDYIATIVSHEQDHGDRRVAEIEFDPQKQTDGLGSDYHPSVRTHEKMAARLVERIKVDLHW